MKSNKVVLECFAVKKDVWTAMRSYIKFNISCNFDKQMLQYLRTKKGLSTALIFNPLFSCQKMFKNSL